MARAEPLSRFRRRKNILTGGKNVVIFHECQHPALKTVRLRPTSATARRQGTRWTILWVCWSLKLLGSASPRIAAHQDADKNHGHSDATAAAPRRKRKARRTGGSAACPRSGQPSRAGLRANRAHAGELPAQAGSLPGNAGVAGAGWFWPYSGAPGDQPVGGRYPIDCASETRAANRAHRSHPRTRPLAASPRHGTLCHSLRDRAFRAIAAQSDVAPDAFAAPAGQDLEH